MDKIIIRHEHKADERQVDNLIRESFWNVYTPGCSEHFIMHNLRKAPEFIRDLDLVMEMNREIIGQAAFLETVIEYEDSSKLPVLILGPICIAPEYSRRGYGKMLLDESIERAKSLGYGAIVLEGNIEFYGKSGFDYAYNFHIRSQGTTIGEDNPYLLCKELKTGYLLDAEGEFITPAAYFVSEQDVEMFDKQFPSKEKLKLPGQLL